MIDDIDSRPTWRVTRAGVGYVFGLNPAAVADLESRRVLVFDRDEQIDLAEAAARIFAEGRLLQLHTLERCSAVASLASELGKRMNAMWTAMSAEKPSKDDLLSVVVDTMEATQRILDDMAAVITSPIGSPERPQHEEDSPCALN